MPISAINGLNIYWEMTGERGEPVVFVHGSWGDHTNWAAVMPPLSASFRVVTYDRRGHSQSERLGTQGSINDDVADLAALIEHLDVEPAHVVSSSFGASIALNLAAQKGSLFRSLIAHEPPLFSLLGGMPNAQSALDSAHSRIARVVALLAAGDNSTGAREFVETIAAGPGTWNSLPHKIRDTFVFNAPTWLDEMRDPDVYSLNVDGLRAFAAPVLLTMGDQSPSYFPIVVAQLAEALPHAQTHTYLGAGHVPHLSHSADYVRVITRFIEAHAAR
jgi:pimeloyl-ACP methyl ester carboxylesterase